MNKRIQAVMLFLSIFMAGNIFAQKVNIDSLENVLKSHRYDDTIKVNLLNAIGYGVYTKDAEKTRRYAFQAEKLSDRLHFQKGKSESLWLTGVSYVRKDNEKAFEYYHKALEIANEINYKVGVIKCLNAIGNIYGYKGENAKAIEYCQKAFKQAEELNNKLEMAKCLRNISQFNSQLGNYEDALEGYKKALIYLKELDEKYLIAGCLHNMGTIYSGQGNYPLALEHYQHALEIATELNEKQGEFAGYASIGNIYFTQSDYEKALEYAQKSLKIAEETNEKQLIATANRSIGGIYKRTNNLLALEYFQKALKLSEELNQIPFTIETLIYVGEFYFQKQDYENAKKYFQDALSKSEDIGKKRSVCNAMYSLGEISLKERRYSDALTYAQKSLAIANELKLLKDQKDIHDLLSRIYANNYNYKKAFEHHVLFKELNDSVFNDGNVKRIAELEYRYKYEKEKQALELQQQQKDVILVAEKKQQRIIMFSFIGAFILVSLLAMYVYRSYRIKRQSNLILTKQKQEIEAKNEDLVQLNEEISAQRDEIEAQRDLVVLQKDHIQAQKEKITDSIDYARHIQQALLPSSEFAASNLGEHFILFKPKDIVSGDFYWATRVNKYLVVTVADCTGHGVPGAFMSMLGISFLNEIVGKKEVVKASEILDQLRNAVVDALRQRWETGEQKDGMDMAVIVINTEKAHLQYAGAHSPLYIVAAGKELKVIKPNNQTVAINIEMKPFTNHEVELGKGDCIYLTTDGYHDQFGGPSNKKFKGKQLKELLVSIAEKPMGEQRELLNSTFESWRGSCEQIDDVTILGMRI